MRDETEVFLNFVSLGSACQTASSMEKYGLRSWSGPFDWLVTDSLQWVLHYMETDFENFLKKENLERCQENPRAFAEKKSGFLFRHDHEYPFEEKYDELKEKYRKKIDRFQEETVKKTCFLRTVISSDEVKYIASNYKYINDVIKRKNSSNEIIFLLRQDVEICEPISFRYYVMPGKWNGGPKAIIRSWFDGADEFLEYCVRRYDVMALMKNIAFDRNKREKAFHDTQVRYRTLLRLSDCDSESIDVPENIIIYGAGNIGRKFYEKIKEKCSVECFIDNDCEDKEIDGIPVKRLEETGRRSMISYIVTPTYDFQNIYQDIKAYDDSAEIISLDSVLGEY